VGAVITRLRSNGVYRRALTFGLALIATFGLFAAPAQAAKTPACADFILGSAPTLHPEGIAFDPFRNRFLVGSVTHGTVSVVNPDGTARTLVSDPVLLTTMGLSVDAVRGRLLVVNGDIGLADRTTPHTVRKTAGLGIYDLRTGRRIRYVDLGALDPTREHFGNDVAVALDGTAYVTDSFSGAVYRVPVFGAPGVLVRDDALTPVGVGNGANGIVLDPRGFLLVAQSSAHALYRVPLRDSAGIERVSIPEEIGAPDGLLSEHPGSLLAVDNTGANRLVRLVSTDGWHTATLRASVPWPDPAPTTMARGRCGIYLLSGRLDLLLIGSPSDEFRLRRFSDS
jgi:sugar lactone lactonase YvrE